MREWMKQARKEAGLSCADMAKALGMSEGFYSRIETGQRKPKMDIDTAVLLSEILRVPLMTIINYETR